MPVTNSKAKILSSHEILLALIYTEQSDKALSKLKEGEIKGSKNLDRIVDLDWKERISPLGRIDTSLWIFDKTNLLQAVMFMRWAVNKTKLPTAPERELIKYLLGQGVDLFAVLQGASSPSDNTPHNDYIIRNMNNLLRFFLASVSSDVRAIYHTMSSYERRGPLICSISKQVPVVPVRIRDKVYDLSALALHSELQFESQQYNVNGYEFVLKEVLFDYKYFAELREHYRNFYKTRLISNLLCTVCYNLRELFVLSACMNMFAILFVGGIERNHHKLIYHCNIALYFDCISNIAYTVAKCPQALIGYDDLWKTRSEFFAFVIAAILESAQIIFLFYQLGTQQNLNDYLSISDSRLDTFFWGLVPKILAVSYMSIYYIIKIELYTNQKDFKTRTEPQLPTYCAKMQKYERDAFQKTLTLSFNRISKEKSISIDKAVGDSSGRNMIAHNVVNMLYPFNEEELTNTSKGSNRRSGMQLKNINRHDKRFKAVLIF